MKGLNVLLINKFLYPKGGSETYFFKLGEYLESQGHKVDYFGMHHEENIVFSSLNKYVSSVDFRGASLAKLLYPFKIIYSIEAKTKIREIIMETKPDIIHLNNFNFQITPSILYEIKKFNIPVVMTLHDFQLICPNHMLYLETRKEICEKCRDGNYLNCIKNKCIHNSIIKSFFAALEGFLYYKLKTYTKNIDFFVAPSIFIRDKVIEFGLAKEKIVTLHNFVTEAEGSAKGGKSDYVLYFGRLSIQKGIGTLIEACNRLPYIKFIFAGGGELEGELSKVRNIQYVGFKKGEELEKLINGSLFSVCPSEWYENCPMSVLESQMNGTPVIGAAVGGIPELINDGYDGLLYKAGNVNDLVEKIEYLYNNRDILESFSLQCKKKVTEEFSISNYYLELMKIYKRAIYKHVTAPERGAENESIIV